MFKVLKDYCEPVRSTKYSACVDLFSAEDVVIGAGETVLVPLGVNIDLEFIKNLQECQRYDFTNDENVFDEFSFIDFMSSHQLNIHIRSSMSAKYGLIISNGTGIIDLDYPGEIMICLHNPIKPKYQIREDDSFNLSSIWTHLCGMLLPRFSDVQIKKGDKIAQISLVEHKTYLFGVETKEKRKGGFGSTDNLFKN